MCDEITERDNDAYLLKQGGASRREALALMSAVGLAAMLPAPAKSSLSPVTTTASLSGATTTATR